MDCDVLCLLLEVLFKMPELAPTLSLPKPDAFEALMLPFL
jgi:hypothetical protein